MYFDFVRYTVGKGDTVGRECLAHALTSVQKEVLIGSLLGDARLECRSRQGTARLRIHHAESQRAYLFWKYEVFRNFVDREPWDIQWFDDRTRREYQAWFFHTRTSLLFRPYHEFFYDDGRKRVLERIKTLLTPRILAVWFMDDGCCYKDSMILNTQSFTYAEQELLQCILLRTFGIQLSIQKDRNNFRLYASGINAEYFREIIRPHILPSMQRKVLPVTTDPEPAHIR